MATKVRRTISDFTKHAVSYLTYRQQAAEATKPRDREKGWLRKWVEANGKPDAEGNLRVYFPGDEKMLGAYGMELRKISGGDHMDSEEVLAFLTKKVNTCERRSDGKGLTTNDLDRVFVPSVQFTPDELYTLQAEGKITEPELRSLIHENDPTYQLWPIDEPPVEDTGD